MNLRPNARARFDGAGRGRFCDHAEAAGSSHTVAVLTDGSVACWGRNEYGQCTVPSGIGTPENPVASIAAGEYLFE